MKAKLGSHWMVAVGVVLILGLAGGGLAVSLGRAQAPEPPRGVQSPDAPDAHSNYIPVQGRLTDAGGNPLDGEYPLTFRLYDTSSGGAALCEDIRSTTVEQGLFQTYMQAVDCPIDGRQLYLGIEVNSDGEMTPRRYIDNVPYAWSLRPGAKVEAELDDPLFYTLNTGSGAGVWGASLTGAGVHGAGGTSPGVEGYSLTGPGVYASSLGGVAIAAAGVITSTEPTYVWISGNGVRQFGHNDSTIIDMNNHGGANIMRGAVGGTKNVILPITIPGTLYGQDVRLTALDVYWVGATQFDAITAVILRRQTGVCTTSECFENIVFDSADHTCEFANEPTGCMLHYDLSENNVLSPTSGVLYLTLELAFSGEASPIDVGGARLTLEYDE